MSHAYEHPYEWSPSEGPDAGRLVFLPRRYDWYEVRDLGGRVLGRYVWDDRREGYAWVPDGVDAWAN